MMDGDVCWFEMQSPWYSFLFFMFLFVSFCSVRSFSCSLMSVGVRWVVTLGAKRTTAAVEKEEQSEEAAVVGDECR